MDCFHRSMHIFQRQLVADFESGQYNVPQLECLHGIGNRTIYNWIYKFSTFNEKGYRIVEMKDSSSKKVKELEQAVGQKQIMIDYLEKMMEIAKQEFEIDIK